MRKMSSLHVIFFGLFTILNVINAREAPPNHPANICLAIETPFQLNYLELECDHRKFHNWRLGLLNPEALPEVPSIRKLIIGDEGPSWGNIFYWYEIPFDLAIILHLASKLPNLEHLDCRYIQERCTKAYYRKPIQDLTFPRCGQDPCVILDMLSARS